MQSKRYAIKMDRSYIGGKKIEPGMTHLELTDDEAKYPLLHGEVALDPAKEVADDEEVADDDVDRKATDDKQAKGKK